jgi:hypothetical protein
MILLKNIEQLLKQTKEMAETPGCLADTSFLYALAFDDDRLHKKPFEFSNF